jgi:CHAD domain-containing protein
MSTSAGKVIVAALDQRWEEYRAQLKTCSQKASEESVHDLRVTARRVLGVLDVVRDLHPEAKVQKARRYFKDQLDALDDLRDVQVILLELTEAPDSLADLGKCRTVLAGREKRLSRRARQEIAGARPSSIKKRLSRMREDLIQGSKRRGFTKAVFVGIDNAYARAAQVMEQVSGEHPATIHQARLAFKKFRYMAEILWPLLPGAPEELLERMHDYQGLMGDVGDVQSLLDTLQELSGSDAQTFGQSPMGQHFARRRAQSIAVFMKQKAEFAKFWRSSATAPFPWESPHEPIPHTPRRRGVHPPRGGNRGAGPATPPERQGPPADAPDRQGLESPGDTARSDREQPLPSGEPDSGDPGETIRVE